MDLRALTQAPIRLEPDNYTHNMWGGDWIPRFKNLPVPTRPVGESWEFSAHRDRPNRIRLPDGRFIFLSDLLSSCAAELLGSARLPDGDASTCVPFLLKFIDSKDELSVQVHPSDEKARVLENDSGKSEAWYVLDADTGEDGGYIYIGFNPDKAVGYAGPSEFEEAFLSAILQANSLGPTLDAAQREKAARLVIPFLNRVRVKAGDMIRVDPGTVHAIGNGIRLFEIQQTSDITYRLWDWNRPDAGKLNEKKMVFRPLHLEKAKQVLDFTARPPADYFVQPRGEILFEERERRFQVSLVSLSGQSRVDLPSGGRFFVLSVIEGAMRVETRGNGKPSEWGEIRCGHSLLVPASVESIRLEAVSPSARAIKSNVPA